MLSVPSKSEENAVGDYDEHEGHDPKKEDEAGQPEVEVKAEPKPEPKHTSPAKKVDDK